MTNESRPTGSGTIDPKSGTHPFELVLAWGFVGIPLLWGVLQTLRNALKLFY
jgi:hypothetical protein